MTITDKTLLKDFLAFSTAVTGFTRFELMSTGQAELFLSTLIEVVGEVMTTKLLGTYNGLAASSESDTETLLREAIFSDEQLGPIARNIIKMWYVGNWYQLPAGWRAVFGIRDKDANHVVSPIAYTEGLAWKAIGANPRGAKAPGYASWADAPSL